MKQDEEWQTKFKASYFLRENQQEVLKEIASRLEKAELEAQVIYSHDEFLDFLRYHASRGYSAGIIEELRQLNFI